MAWNVTNGIPPLFNPFRAAAAAVTPVLEDFEPYESSLFRLKRVLEITVDNIKMIHQNLQFRHNDLAYYRQLSYQLSDVKRRISACMSMQDAYSLKRELKLWCINYPVVVPPQIVYDDAPPPLTLQTVNAMREDEAANLLRLTAGPRVDIDTPFVYGINQIDFETVFHNAENTEKREERARRQRNALLQAQLLEESGELARAAPASAASRATRLFGTPGLGLSGWLGAKSPKSKGKGKVSKLRRPKSKKMCKKRMMKWNSATKRCNKNKK